MMQCSGIKVSGYRVSNPISARRSMSLPFGGEGGGSGLAVSAAVFVTGAWNLSVSGSVSCSSLQRKDRQHIASPLSVYPPKTCTKASKLAPPLNPKTRHPDFST